MAYDTPYETKEMTGSLLQNQKRPDKQDADYTGSVKIDGKEYWCNLWKGETKDKKPRLSLSFRPKVASPNKAAENDPMRSAYRYSDDNGDAPF